MSLIPFVSSRKNFYDAGKISRKSKVKFVNLVDPRPANNKAVSMTALREFLQGKHVVILVHGYNNSFPEICDAYLRITNQLTTNRVEHDTVVGYLWPGGNKALSYCTARRRARQLSKRMGNTIAAIAEASSRVDIISHSLGCFLTLSALRTTGGACLGNVYLMAAAVGNHKLTSGLPFANAVKYARTTFVFKSRDDNVLRMAFPMGKWDNNALGYTGPVPSEMVVSNALTVDCSGKPDPIGHKSYSRRTEIYSFIADNMMPSDTPREVVL